MARSSAAAAATSAEAADVPETDVVPPPAASGPDALPGRGRGTCRRRGSRTRRAASALVGARDADDAAVAGRVGRGRRAVVAGRGDDDDVVIPRVVDRGLQRGAEARVAERHVDDVGAVIDGPDDALDDVAVLAEAVGVEDGDRHDLHAVEADAGDARCRCRCAAAMIPAMAVPWPLGSVVRVGAGEDATCRRRAGRRGPAWPASTPVSRTATTADARRVDRAVDVVPADPRQRPLVVVARVVRGRLGRADALALDAARRPRSARSTRPRRPVGHADDGHPQGRDRVDDVRAFGAARMLERSAALVPARERDDVVRCRHVRRRRRGGG